MRSARVEVLALVVASIFLLVPAFYLNPRGLGDSGEYFLMAESLLNHGSPDLRHDDLASMSAQVALHPVAGTMRSLSAYRPSSGGALYAQHFWAYPAATLPVRLVLRALGMHEYKAFQITNALMLLGALALCLRVTAHALPWRLLACGLLLFSPLALFAMLPHAEVFTASLVVAALATWRMGQPRTALFMAALASLQAPPALLLVGVLGCSYVGTGSDRGGRVWRGAVAASPALAPYLFNLCVFGRPSLIADENVHHELIGLSRAAELLGDPNIGLIRSAPLTVVLVLGVSLAALIRGFSRAKVAALWAVVIGMALVCSGMADWNHGTSGPSRYALWMFPLLALLLVDMSAALRSTVLAVVGWAAVAVQALIFVAHGGFTAPTDYLEHSWGAQALLRSWPELYSPSPEIFVERTLHTDLTAELTDPVVYRVDGRCRKAWAQKRHAPDLRAACGPEPAAFSRFQADAGGRDRRNAWTYVDY